MIGEIFGGDNLGYSEVLKQDQRQEKRYCNQANVAKIAGVELNYLL